MMDKARIRYWTYAAIGGVILFGDTVNAQSGSPHSQLDMDFWFRAVMSCLLGVLIWIAKGTDIRLKDAEDKLKEFDRIHATRAEKIEYHDKRIQSLEHEQKNHASLIGMQRELLLTKYHDKEDTERHRAHVESTLTQMSKRLERMESKMRTD